MRWEDIHIPTLAPRLRVPVLLVHDREDPDVPCGQAEQIMRAWPERAWRRRRDWVTGRSCGRV